MATAFVNPQQPRIDAWIQPGCRADIAVVSTESWPVDTVVTIGVADAAGVIAVPLLTITPDLATLTATVALTGVQVAALAVACPPPYGVIDWQWRTGAGSPLGVGSLHWDLTGARTTQTVTVMMGPAGPGATPEAISALVEDYLVAHPPTGSGDVTGPASAVAGNLAALDATGKILSDSGSKPADFAPASHNHAGVYDPAGTAAGLVGGITPGSIGAQPAGSYAPALGADDNYLTDTEKAQLHTHPAVIAQGATQADARTAIGAGTSSLVIGTAAGTAAEGNDARLSDARTPTAHTHPATGISDSTAVGRSVVTATDAAAARTAIGAGTLASETLPATIVDAKGDLIVATAADTVSRLPVGATTGHVLTVDPAETTGLKWAAGGGGGAPLPSYPYTKNSGVMSYAGDEVWAAPQGRYAAWVADGQPAGTLTPFPVPRPCVLADLQIHQLQAADAGTLTVAIYGSSECGLPTGAPVWVSGPVPATSSGPIIFSSIGATLESGMYWIAYGGAGFVTTRPRLCLANNVQPWLNVYPYGSANVTQLVASGYSESTGVWPSLTPSTIGAVNNDFGIIGYQVRMAPS